MTGADLDQKYLESSAYFAAVATNRKIMHFSSPSLRSIPSIHAERLPS